MRLYEVEYSKDELAQLREELRREYPDLTEEQLDEILPLIPLALGTAARAGVGMLARGAMGAGRLAMKGIGAAARGVGKVAKNVGGTIHQAGSSLSQVGKDKLKKQAVKTVTNKLTTGGRTNQSDGGDIDAVAQELGAIQQANSAKEAEYIAKMAEIEKSVQDMKKTLGAK